MCVVGGVGGIQGGLQQSCRAEMPESVAGDAGGRGAWGWGREGSLKEGMGQGW